MAEEKNKKRGISRRDFIKGSGMAVGGAALSTGLLAACAPKQTPADQPLQPGETPPPSEIIKEVPAVLPKFSVNGETYEFKVKDNWTLAEVLRRELGFTGTKEACGEGACGMCTVLIDGKPQLACITLAKEVAGKQITTIEGLEKPGAGLHPVQKAFIVEHGFQCGLCTPGMIMAAVALLNRIPSPTEDQIRKGMSNNFCYCGTYNTIIRSVQNAAGKMRGG